jgi:hypothetical protein
VTPDEKESEAASKNESGRGRSAWVEVGNEFTTVRVRKVATRNGERLEIVSPKTGHSICLDALALESLTWQEPEFFSRFLETPFGPEPAQA